MAQVHTSAHNTPHAAKGVDGIADLDEVLKELAGDIFVAGVHRGQLQCDLRDMRQR